MAADDHQALYRQTGDLDILLEAAPYFKDPQALRGTATDREWTEGYGNRQRTEAGEVYQGSILEHLLIQHLAAFYEVGAHNIFRLRGADWNDALDMAAEHGESVAFTCAYAGNLLDLAGLLHQLAGKQEKAELLAELQELPESGLEVYGDSSRKTAILERYARRCIHKVSGQTVSVSLTANTGNDNHGRIRERFGIAHQLVRIKVDIGFRQGPVLILHSHSGTARLIIGVECFELSVQIKARVAQTLKQRIGA